MSFSLFYNPENDIIMGSMEGDFNSLEVQEYLMAVGVLVREKNCRRVLTDMRTAIPKITVLEIDDIPPVAAKAGLGLTVRRALIVAADFEDYAFYRASSSIQGQNVRIFKNIDDAKSWLFEAE